jgi:hypothetical protein
VRLFKCLVGNQVHKVNRRIKMDKDPYTAEQLASIAKLYERNRDGAQTLEEFSERFGHWGGGFIGGKWRGMFIGIEQDGYTHS